MPPKPSDRPIYTLDQLNRYFDHINLPQSQQFTKDALQSKSVDDQITFLSALTRHQLCAVPFENLDLHYAPVKGISLNASHLYDKVVTRKAGRGGYCMQNNSFFGTIIRSLGFSVMSVGARIARATNDGTAGKSSETEVEYGGHSHQVNIITLSDGRKVFADVGYGSSGPTYAIPLVEGFSATNTGTKDNIATTMRLSRGFAANNTAKTPDQRLWIFSVKYGTADDESKNWIPCYSFAEVEFFPYDFEIMSNWVSTNRASIFVRNVICQKFLMSEDKESIIGDITLNDDAIKERRFGANNVLAEIKSEKDRVEALEKYMGVKLSEAERQGILGMPTALP